MELSNTRPENTRKKYFKNCQNIYKWQVLYCDARLACGLRLRLRQNSGKCEALNRI